MSQPPCVLHLTRDFPLGRDAGNKGGISTAVGGLTQALAARGVTSAVLSFDGWRPQGRGPAPPLAAPALALGSPCLRLSHEDHLPAGRRFGEDHAPGLIHVHHDMLWPFGRDLAEELGIPALVSIHVAQGLQNLIRGFEGETQSLTAQETALREAPALLAPSPSVASWLGDAYPEIKSRLHLAPLGLQDTPALAEARARRRPSSAGVILYVGRFADIKGTDVLFEAAPRVLRRWPEARFDLVGGMPLSQRIERRWRRRWLRDTPPELQDRLIFRGWLEGDALEDAFSEASILVAPSRYETFGFGALEGLFRGLPVIAGDAGGLAWMIEDGLSGRLIPPGEADALAEGIDALLGDPEAAFALGQRGAARAIERFSWGAVIDAHLQIYAAFGVS